MALSHICQLTDRITKTTSLDYILYQSSTRSFCNHIIIQSFLYHIQLSRQRDVFIFSLSLNESQDHLICLCVLCLIMNHWLKFPSSCDACSATTPETHIRRQGGRKLTFQYWFAPPAKRWRTVATGERGGEIHQRELVINDSDKYCDINVKGHVWHWAHSAPPRRGEWAMSWAPLPAQRTDQQGNEQLNVTSALSMCAHAASRQPRGATAFHCIACLLQSLRIRAGTQWELSIPPLCRSSMQTIIAHRWEFVLVCLER